MVNEGERGHEDVVLEVPLPHAAAPTGPPRLLTNRPFLWLVLGDSFAQMGRWAFFLAVVGDATYRLDATPAQVALLIGSFSLPLILISPLYGSAADRWSPKWLLVITLLVAAITPLIALTTTSLGWLYVATALYGIEFAGEAPARGALVPRLVPQERLVQANGMISAALAVQLVVGPGLAAILVRLGGRGAPYLVTIGAVALALLFYLLVPDRRKASGGTAGVFQDVGIGFREGWGTGVLRRLFLISISIWFLIGILISLEPSYVKGELGRGQEFLGLLWAVYGTGEVIGSVTLSRIRSGTGREPRLVAMGLLLAAVGFLLYVTVAAEASAVAGNLVFGIGFPFYTASSYALIQRLARHPGKVTAVFSMMGEGGPVVAALLLFAAGDAVAVRPWLLVSGVAFSVVALVALRVARREPVATADRR